MEDYVDLWDEYAIQFCKTLEYTMHGDWAKLDDDEQEIAALWKLLVDMYNGGFMQFFCNWGYTGYWYAMRGLQRIEAYSLFQLLHQTYTDVFDKFKEDSRLEAYWDIPEYLTEEDEAYLDQTDQLFYEKEGAIFAERAYYFYCNTLKKTAREQINDDHTKELHANE